MTPAHRALVTRNNLAYLSFECLNHPPFSPEVAASDYHLFAELKKQFKRGNFSSEPVAISALVTWFYAQRSKFYLNGLQKIEQRAKECIELHGEFFE
jgi:histone-lysine N-methyltransferase SETMAR